MHVDICYCIIAFLVKGASGGPTNDSYGLYNYKRVHYTHAGNLLSFL